MTYKDFKNKYQNEIVEKQRNGISFADLSREYGVPKNIIYDVIAPTYRHGAQQVSDEEVVLLKEMYTNGMSQVALAEKFHIHHKTILECVRDDVPVVYGRFQRVHKLNEEFFDIIDNQDKAYILGFLYADGQNCYSKRAVRLQLTEEDVEILYRISNVLQYTRPLTYVPAREIYDTGYISKPQYALDINSAHMSKRLSELGVVQNKSLILTFPHWMSDELIPHFLRGYIDGDGCIARQPHSYSVCFISTLSFCESALSIVYRLTGLKAHLKESRNHNGITTDWTISKKDDTKEFLDWIYKDAHLYLKRKHDIYLKKYVTDWN